MIAKPNKEKEKTVIIDLALSIFVFAMVRPWLIKYTNSQWYLAFPYDTI